jgi:hypothetical protein
VVNKQKKAWFLSESISATLQNFFNFVIYFLT